MVARVLIVDDDPVQRRLLDNMVRKFGHEPVLAESGDQAIAQLTGPERCDCVVLDLVMPDLDGLDVLATLRRQPTSRRPRVLVLTTYDDETRIRGALALGADGFLLKDSTAHQLITAIRSVAGGLTALSPAARDIGVTNPARTRVPPTLRRTKPQLDEPGAQAQARQSLTSREAEILELLGEGLSNRAIASQLGISERTVKIHVSNVLSKLDVESRTQAALLARRLPT
jgi:DNA-binding NarL/FixJ family response regulator